MIVLNEIRTWVHGVDDIEAGESRLCWRATCSDTSKKLVIGIHNFYSCFSSRCMHACMHIYIYICYLCTCKASSFKLFHFVFVLPCCSQSFKASPSHSGHGRQRKSERPWALSRSLPVPSHYTFHRRASPRRPRSRDFPSDCQWQNLRHTNQVLVCSRITVRSP